MEWDDKWRIGISVIDSQHKQLIRMGSDINKAMEEGVKAEVLQRLLEDLQAYATRHYAVEEKYMRDVSYPGLERQVERHRAFAAHSRELIARFAQSGMEGDLVESLRREHEKWVEHLSGLDQEFGRFWQEKMRRERGS